METDPQVIAGKIGMSRRYGRTENIEELETELRAAQIHHKITRTLKNHPPLTREQIAEIVRLLTAGGE